MTPSRQTNETPTHCGVPGLSQKIGIRQAPRAFGRACKNSKKSRSSQEGSQEAKKATKKDGSKSKIISFGTGSSKLKTSTPVKSVLKRGSRETIKIYKHELVVDVKVRVKCTRKKNEIRKKVCACLRDTLTSSGRHFSKTRQTLLSPAREEGNP